MRRRWDRYAIRAAVHRRGKSLTDLALENGLEQSACRTAIVRPNKAGEKAIADFLGVPVRVLWPERYRADPQSQLNAARTAAASPIGGAA